MRITKVKLNNYVCFYETPEFELGPGINFVVGKNNAGKTALLDALTPGVNGQVHRSEKTLPSRISNSQVLGRINYQIEYGWSEKHLMQNLVASLHNVRLDETDFFIPLHPKFSGQFREYIDRFFDGAFGLRLTYGSGGSRDSETVLSIADLDPALTRFSTEDALSFRIRMKEVAAEEPELHRNGHAVVDYWLGWQDRVPNSIYRFQAVRPVLPAAPEIPDLVLNNNASNLGQVLDTIQSRNRGRFHKYLQAVQRVIPEILDLRTVSDGQGTVSLMLDYIDAHYERNDLGVSQDKCGTGVGQILAMLYVVLFYNESQPRVLLIDEPNSFLHPGAIRKLLEIFQEHDHHQYIIATHSPTAIMSVKEKRILLVTRENMVSSVKSVNVNDNAELEDMLRQIGSSRSDIFGMDAVIWVEGKTDRICFKRIMDLNGGLGGGVDIIEVVHTGDFNDKRRGALIEQIYARLSGSVGILPSVLAFVFDGDLQNDDFEETNTRKFLPRQNYESYLIVPEYLAVILNRDAAEDKAKDQTAKSVESWICEQEGADFDDLDWLKSVDGAKLLDRLFQDLAGISYKGNKVQYGEEITKRILADNPSHFHEIVKLIKCILKEANQPASP